MNKHVVQSLFVAILFAFSFAGQIFAESIEGELTKDDDVLRDDEYVDFYELELNAGDILKANMTSDFDNYLVVFGPLEDLPGYTFDENQEEEGINIQNDDGPDGTNSQVLAIIEISGLYYLGATSLEPKITGKYDLEWEVIKNVCIRTETGTIEDGDETHSNGSFVDWYEIEFEAGILVYGNVASDFDSMIVVICPDGEVIENDDDGVGLLPAIDFDTLETGTFKVGVTTFEKAEQGEYILTLYTSIYNSGSVTVGNSGEKCEVEVEIAEGSYVRAGVVSDWDNYLEVETPGGEFFSDDDSAGDYNAYIHFIAETTGAYKFSISAVDANVAGDCEYYIEIFGGAGGPITPSGGGRGNLEYSDYSGTLKQSDETRQGGQYIDWYEVSASQGQRLQVSVEGDFDTYIIVKGSNPGESWEDDDGGEGLNSLLDFTCPSTGTYKVGVTSLDPGVSGSYSLRIGVGDSAPASTSRPGGNQGPGEVFEDMLDENSDTLPDQNGKLVNWYEQNFEEGDEVTITLDSDDFDCYLLIEDGDGNLLAENDDGAETTNSELTFTVPASGSYFIGATSYEAGEQGAYRLSISRRSR
ncbi:MAG: PPC domain-containing protein [Planctomycetes bacterium]|nr:PPC domain-containing protein [Planctomycetota bacterium]